MRTSRTSLSILAIGSLLAGLLLVGAVAPVDADTIDVECVADDSVQQGLGTLNGNPLVNDSQAVMDLIGSQADPPVPSPATITSPIKGTINPSSVPPGSSDLDFTVTLLIDSVFLSGLEDNGISSVDFSNMAFTLAPGSGVTGSTFTVNTPDTSIDVSDPTFPGITVTKTYDVTAPIGEMATWDLTDSQVALHLTIPPSATIPGTVELDWGMSCTASDPLITATVLPPFQAGGPIVPELDVETDEGVPVDVDLLSGVEPGDAATDPDSLEILADPSDGTVSLDGGIATYTPDAGFVGDDQFAYQVCTVPFSVGGVNEIDTVTIEDIQPTIDRGVATSYTLTVDGETTGLIPRGTSTAEVQAALEALSTVGAGNVVVSGTPDLYTIEFVGDLAETSMDVSIDDEFLRVATASVEETQAAQVGSSGVLCNASVVNIAVGAVAAEEETTTPPPATPQAETPTYTG